MRLQDVSSRPAHTRSPDPRILPSPQKPTKRDAYTAFGSPPDSSWSTLPTKTGRSKTKVGATRVKTSGGFRLPGLVNRNVRTKMPRDSDEERRVSSTQKRRVVTYLPPPRTNVANTNAAPRELESASTSADVCGNSHGDVVAGPPSSPLGPSATPPRFRQGLKAQRQASPLSQRSPRHISYKEARASLPSPPRSDPPVPGSSPVGLEYWSRSPAQTHFDMGRLQRGYAGTRKKIAEVCIADALFVDFHPF
ncbi:hypothetical protein B0H21DRAFT_822781 [Amylocystis lapponica]|nr:hypothetical protein B0H21DRAFT_822781 [Amylocystis lapponica]